MQFYEIPSETTISCKHSQFKKHHLPILFFTVDNACAFCNTQGAMEQAVLKRFVSQRKTLSWKHGNGQLWSKMTPSVIESKMHFLSWKETDRNKQKEWKALLNQVSPKDEEISLPTQKGKSKNSWIVPQQWMMTSFKSHKETKEGVWQWCWHSVCQVRRD